MFGEKPVDDRRRKKNLRSWLRLCARLRLSLRLIAQGRHVRMRPHPKTNSQSKLVTNAVHRFDQTIAGRPYLIEVAAVSQDRWRAYIVRIPGVPTALMPFYGRTPDEAAGLLTDWLTRAYERVERQVPPT